MSPRGWIRSSSFFVVGLIIPACTVIPTRTAIVVTPKNYSEDHLFYTSEVPGKVLPQLVPGNKAESQHLVHAGDPLTIIIDSIHLPRGWVDDIDIVFLLDLQIDKTNRIENLAFFYQKGAKAGYNLNFQDLVVTNTPTYDPSFQPYFRLRVIAIQPPADELKKMLGDLSNVAGQVGQFFPNPYLPAFSTALKLGQTIAGTEDDVMIVDYQFQLFSQEISGTTGIGRLQTGEWIALGIPNVTKDSPRAADDFWSKTYYWDSARRRVVNISQSGESQELNVPFVTFTIAKGYSVVPAVVQQRAAEIMKYIDDKRMNSEAPPLKEMLNSTASAYYATDICNKLKKERNMGVWKKAIGMLSSQELTQSDKDSVMGVLNNLIAPEAKLGTPDEWQEWWKKTGVLGEIGQDGHWMRKGK